MGNFCNGINVIDKKHQVVIYPEAFGVVGESAVFREVMNNAKKVAESAGISRNIFKGKKLSVILLFD